jgi:uncharacterized iron-regulated protein
LIAGCAHPARFAMPEATSAIDGASGAPLATSELLRRVGAADIVLLGEVHDNPVDHALRGALITAFADRHPALVFEQFNRTAGPIAPPASGEPMETWLDRNGFDRNGWKWPLHQPVVDAAIAHGRAIWGSGLSRDTLRAIVRQGGAGAPAELRTMMERAPLDSPARAVMDQELIEGHCGQLPAEMVPGMRTMQEFRDLSMANALVQASAQGPAWLIAGNGHVRRDVAVPRVLRAAAPGKRVLVVGLLEREPNGDAPSADERKLYDVVIVTPRTQREDPCAGFRIGR